MTCLFDAESPIFGNVSAAKIAKSHVESIPSLVLVGIFLPTGTYFAQSRKLHDVHNRRNDRGADVWAEGCKFSNIARLLFQSFRIFQINITK